MCVCVMNYNRQYNVPRSGFPTWDPSDDVDYISYQSQPAEVVEDIWKIPGRGRMSEVDSSGQSEYPDCPIQHVVIPRCLNLNQVKSFALT